MFPFVFKLARGITLMEKDDRYFITSQTPIRYLRLNQQLYEIIKMISAGASLDGITGPKTWPEQKKIVEVIFTLVAKGFLELSSQDGDQEQDPGLPAVTVIIPVRNRPEDIRDCLSSLGNLDYPKEKLEIIVVDDASTDDTAGVIREFGVKLVSHDVCKGPGACRNRGGEAASGEILAFLDSDCTVSPSWLKEMVRFFSLPGIGAMGGFVAGYYQSSAVDRYEDAFSSLNMGKRVLFESNAASMFYVPTCNFLVRREVFREIQGFQPQMQVGEDVDFCWRLRNAGHHLLYVPTGVVFHKHRNLFRKMLKRRFDYGTSEPDLYRRHGEKKKILPCPLYQGISLILVFGALLSRSVLPLGLIPVLFYLDFRKKKKAVDAYLLPFHTRSIILSTIRSTFSFWYYCCFYLIRYYFIVLVLLTAIFPVFGTFLLFAVLMATLVDYFLKKPRLSFFPFAGIYLLEHTFYQCGVFYGCFKRHYFRSLLPDIMIS
ncbi:mycofactocin biosynthesis glycosyltransferase MftF [Candidatus Formimonas warabiya]|uniref:Mycofactocin system glycosyltransferase n=1 Tax=Formimonas warabiya TaxID=1761012 RepID=A0A3G1KR18_FORW1|nr:mycofactocin biosynthesis glycosyltransferase MftF [Candidatus Formimonas warabiya]ATW24922.1 mycofactocin system glycosyltransferase [Candidatus Formimonas warabiya]